MQVNQALMSSFQSDFAVRSKRATVTSAPPQDASPAWKQLRSYTLFSELLAKDTASGALASSGRELLGSIVNPNDSTATKVHVMSFHVNDAKADDMFYIWRQPSEAGKTNFLVYMPDKNNKSFLEFKNPQAFRKFFKELPNDPAAFKAFLSHFSADCVEHVKRTIENWGADAKVGGVGNLYGNIFEHLDRWSHQSIAVLPVNGLTDIAVKSVSAQGVTTFVGTRPSGEKVLYQYDRKGNLAGVDDKGNYYFMINALFSDRPLIPVTFLDYQSIIIRVALQQIGEWTEGLGDMIANFLEHPFSGLSSLLQSLGVDKSSADRTEQSLDNPVTSLLLFLNKHNHIGKAFRISKKEMNEALSNFGDKAQGAVPVYGQVRSLAALIGKAIKNEPLTDMDIREAREALELRA